MTTKSGSKTSDQVRRLNAGLQVLILINQCVHQSKTSRGLKVERTRKYGGISIGETTQPLGFRWGFEITSKPVTARGPSTATLQHKTAVYRCRLAKQIGIDTQMSFPYDRFLTNDKHFLDPNYE